jgi:hypothetical protein
MGHQALGGIQMSNKIKCLCGILVILFSLDVMSSTGIICQVHQKLITAKSGIPNDYLDKHVLDEVLNFEGFRKYQSYFQFSNYVSNDFRNIISKFSHVATNEVDRFLLLGVGKQFDEDFYIDFLTELCVLQTNNIITARELDWASASTRYDLDSCLIRRYKEPKVISLVNSMKKIFPQQRFWDKVLSGERYTNYLHEAAAGQWGPNPPGPGL